MLDVPQKNDLYGQLKNLIDDKHNKELECRRYLHYAKYLLFKETVINFVYVETEYRAHTGDSDYVISGEVRDESGVLCTRAYVWELKAPQCFVFEKDTENRLRPTRDLVQAENQLLNYFDELKGSSRAHAEFGVSHPENVRLGGVIIGCSRTKVKGDYETAKKARLYEIARRCRDFLYNPANIRLILWDRVLEQLEERMFINQTYETR